jgi:hypothetical protein
MLKHAYTSGLAFYGWVEPEAIGLLLVLFLFVSFRFLYICYDDLDM